MSDGGEDPQVAPGSAGVEQRYIQATLGEMISLESMCPKCQENGETRMMMTKIPHFREVIVSSFECKHCGEENRLVEFGGAFGPKKLKYHLEVTSEKDLSRQIIKSDHGVLSVPELELELGPEAQKGSLNTLEGVLRQVEDGLRFQQPVRKIQDLELHDKIEAFLTKLTAYRSGSAFPFNVWLEDPAGNSYIEALHPDGMAMDPHLTRFEITRSKEERERIGLAAPEEHNTERTEEEEAAVERGEEDGVTQFHQPCPACLRDGEINVKRTTIPHFGPIVIMAFRCATCGYKSNDVKNVGDIGEKGKVIRLRVENMSDLSRDVLKSETTQLIIPELDLELTPGTMGGFFTTVEGLLAQVHDKLASLRQTSFEDGDSAEGGRTMSTFLTKLDEMRQGEHFPFKLELKDPEGMVYVQNPRAHLPPPQNVDPQLEQFEYERTAEEKEELGL